MTGLTPSQTVGPFLSIALPWPDGPYVVTENDPDAIRIFGVVYDGAGVPVPDALVETWQADADGYFNHPDDPREKATDFRGFGRCPTADDGTYQIITRRPGPVPASDSADRPDPLDRGLRSASPAGGPGGAPQAPHIDVAVFARGLLNHLVTRIYFPEEEAANAADPVLNSVDPDRRATLIAVPAEGGYRFDVRLQGAHETVFFAL